MGNPKATKKRLLYFNEVAYETKQSTLGVALLHGSKNRETSFLKTNG
jgi:hypothetical protein